MSSSIKTTEEEQLLSHTPRGFVLVQGKLTFNSFLKEVSEHAF